MSEAGEHLELLKNAVRQSIAALTAVETDTVYRANELTKMLAAEIGERPNETLSLSVDAGASPLLYQARRIAENWADEEGVLFIIDDGGKDEGKRYPFWVEMNALRESWAALNCHVIFFLLPHNYRMLLQVGNHLADWMSVKLRIMSEEIKPPIVSPFVKRKTFIISPLSVLSMMPPQVAHQQISFLEAQLSKAIQNGTEEALLTNRYYLPLFDAALGILDLHRAENFRKKILEKNVSKSDLPMWWYFNYELDWELERLCEAKYWIKKIYNWAKKIQDLKWKARALCAFGTIAESQHKFDIAKKWYEKSLAIEERLGNNKEFPKIYNNLGKIAFKQQNMELAEDWFKKALELNKLFENDYGIGAIYYRLGIFEKERGNFDAAKKYQNESFEFANKIKFEYGVAVSCLELGKIAQKEQKFEDAERWFKQALSAFYKLGHEKLLALTHQSLGIIARLQDRLESSGEWLIKSIKAFTNTNDPENAEKAKDEFQKTYAQASPDVQVKLKEMWEAAGLSEL